MYLIKYSTNSIYSYLLLFICIFISPLLLVIFSPIFWQNINKKLIITILALCSALAAYYYVPEESMDLNSYYNLFNKEISLMDYYINSDGESAKADYLIIFLFFIISYFNLPCEVLAFISAFIYFSSILYISLLLNRHLKLSNKQSTVLPFILVLSEYLLGFTGIRFDNAVLLYLISLVYFILNNRKRAYLFSFLSILVHFSLLPIIFITFLSFNLSEKKIKRISLSIFFLSLFFLPIMFLLKNVFMNLGSFGLGLAYSIDAYVFSESLNDEVLYAGSRFWPVQRLLSFIFLIFIFFRLITNNICIKDRMCKDNIYKFIMIFISFLIFSINNSQLFMRMLLISSYGIILLSFYILSFSNDNKIRTIFNSYIVVHIIIGILANISGNEFSTLFLNSNFLNSSFLNLFL